MSADEEFDWGDNLVAPFNYYVKEVDELQDMKDNHDLDSMDPESVIKYRTLERQYVEDALKLIDLITTDPDELRSQLQALLRDH